MNQQKSWFPTCQDEYENFWTCYKEQRGFLKLKVQTWMHDEHLKPSDGESEQLSPPPRSSDDSPPLPTEE